MKIFDIDRLQPTREFLVLHEDNGQPLVIHSIEYDEWYTGYWNKSFFITDFDDKFTESEVDKVIVLD